MNTKAIRLIALIAMAVATRAAAQSTPLAQTAAAPLKTTSKILYHGGPVLSGTRNVYYIYYGCWGTTTCGAQGEESTMEILTDFILTVGNSPYAQINSAYTDANGQPASSAFIFGGSVLDAYSHGATLTEADLTDVISLKVNNFELPQDPNGVYIILTSADIALQDPSAQFCLTCCQRHGRGLVNGSPVTWGFVGHTGRCPGACGIQPNGVSTPNADLAADSMAAWLAHTLSEIVTNPDRVTGWYDRYGLENTDKCVGTYGTTYPAANGAPANVRLGARDYLLQQNWVRGTGRERCGLVPW